jgi:hypothetical protein
MHKSVASSRLVLLDCGSAKRMTKGLPVGFQSEASFAPFNRRLY